MLTTDELLDRSKHCCLTPVDFLEALVRLADAIQGGRDLSPPVEESFEVNTHGTRYGFTCLLFRGDNAVLSQHQPR